jgi:hypothetical protein
MAEQGSERREKRFEHRVALITAIIAVAMAFSSLGGSNSTKEMLLAQQQASDQWAFYQAKAIREQLYRIERMRLEDDVAERGGSLTVPAREHKDRLLAAVVAEESRYETEKKGIEEKAHELELERDRHRTRDPYFDFGEVLLQIAIVLASMSILTGARPIFHASVVAALAGVILGLNGFLLLFRLPFL